MSTNVPAVAGNQNLPLELVVPLIVAPIIIAPLLVICGALWYRRYRIVHEKKKR